MRNMFNNIYFVAAMSLLAIGYIAYTVYPFIYTDNAAAGDSLVNAVIDPLDDLILSEPHVNSFDSDKDLDITKAYINWDVYPKRNPFATLTKQQGITPPQKLTNKQQKTTSEKVIHKEEIEIPKLNAIVISQQSRLAMINNQLLSIGDTINAFEIKKIEPGYIDLHGPDGSLRLTLYESLYEN